MTMMMILISKKMKRKINILIAILFLISIPYSHANTINQFNNEIKVNSSDRFSVTGYTRNRFGDNYSISLRITGTSNYYGNTISYVEYNDGYRWINVLYYVAYGEIDTYYVNVDFKQFYFRF